MDVLPIGDPLDTLEDSGAEKKKDKEAQKKEREEIKDEVGGKGGREAGREGSRSLGHGQQQDQYLQIIHSPLPSLPPSPASRSSTPPVP